MQLSIVIPAKNEEKRIIYPLIKVYETLKRRFGEDGFEVIVVVNNTTDNTVEVLNTIKTYYNYEALRIVNVGISKGKGDAVLQGLTMARGKYIGFIDADGSSPAEEVLKLFRYLQLQPQTDAVMASRYTTNGRILGKLPFTRRVFSRLFNVITRIGFLLPYADTQCGLKIFRREAIQQIIPEMTTFGWTFDVNLLVLLRMYGYQVKEVASTWMVKDGSTLNTGRALFKVPQEVAKLYFNLATRQVGLWLNVFRVS